eukprot:1195857-Prorocentrum_minimum.AAC.9
MVCAGRSSLIGRRTWKASREGKRCPSMKIMRLKSSCKLFCRGVPGRVELGPRVFEAVPLVHSHRLPRDVLQFADVLQHRLVRGHHHVELAHPALLAPRVRLPGKAAHKKERKEDERCVRSASKP